MFYLNALSLRHRLRPYGLNLIDLGLFLRFSLGRLSVMKSGHIKKRTRLLLTHGPRHGLGDTMPGVGFVRRIYI